VSALHRLAARLGVEPERVHLAATLFPATPQTLAAGEPAWASGAPAEALTLLEEGTLELELTPNPGGPTLRQQVHAPALLGLPSALDGGPRASAARALGPARLRALPRAALQRAVHGDSPAAEALRELILAALWAELADGTVALREHLRVRPAGGEGPPEG
jgi:CRP-like cAMP-binding protein